MTRKEIAAKHMSCELADIYIPLLNSPNINDGTRLSISSGFGWDGSPQGHIFWMRMNNLWMRHGR